MKRSHLLGLSKSGFHKISYAEWGQTHDEKVPPVLCVHGLTRNGRDFDWLANYLADKGLHVFCPDIAGRGESDWLKPNEYTYEQYCADMNAMIARINKQQVDWVGTSMGGLIGLFLASLPNSPIRKLVLNDIGPQVPLEGIRRIMNYADNRIEFGSIEEANRYFRSIYNFGSLSDEQWQHFTENSTRPGKTANKIALKTDPNIHTKPSKSQFFRQLMTAPRRALQGIVFDVDLWHLWQQVKCPVLVIHGKQSDILTAAIVEKMQKTHPLTTVVSIPYAGHAPALNNEEQHEAIYKWLRH